MNAPQSKPDDSDARLSSAYMGLEPEIRDLRHMIGIAKTLFEDTMKSPDSKTGWATVHLTSEQFEQLEFAIYTASGMAVDLDRAYLKAIEEAHT
jgi:hypothetical protein